jgi:hypothetical protein
MITRANPDILIRSADNVPIAIVEVKNRREWPDSLATGMRRNMIAHGVLPPIPYFLLLSQDQGFIWHQKPEELESSDRDPDSSFSMRHIIDRYAPVGLTDSWLRGAELEYIIQKWLDDLASGARYEVDETEQVLADIGFLSAIAGASVLPEAAL